MSYSNDRARDLAQGRDSPDDIAHPFADEALPADGADGVAPLGSAENPSAFGNPSLGALSDNLQMLSHEVADPTVCPKRMLFALAACAPAYPLVIGLAYIDVSGENRKAGVKKPFGQVLSRMVVLGSTHFFQIAVAMGAFYSVDCLLRRQIGIPDISIRLSKDSSSVVPNAQRSASSMGPVPPGSAAAQDARAEAKIATFDANMTRTISGALSGGVVMVHKGVRPVVYAMAAGAILGRFLMPVFEELPGVRKQVTESIINEMVKERQ